MPRTTIDGGMTYAQAVAKVASLEAALAIMTPLERYEAQLENTTFCQSLEAARRRVADLQQYTAAGSVSAIP